MKLSGARGDLQEARGVVAGVEHQQRAEADIGAGQKPQQHRLPPGLRSLLGALAHNLRDRELGLVAQADDSAICNMRQSKVAATTWSSACHM